MKGMGFVRSPLIVFHKLVTSVTCLRAWQADFGLSLGGTPAASGTSPPAVTITGTPMVVGAFRLEVQTTGGLGASTYRYSNNGGATWIEQSVTTAATHAMVGSLAGATLNFPSATYTNDNVYVGSCSGWVDQKSSVQAVQATATKQPLIVPGAAGRLTLRFDGNDDFLNDTTLDLPAPSGGATFYWAVFKHTAWNGANSGSICSAAQTTGQMRVGDLTSSPNMACSLAANGPLNGGATLGSIVRAEARFGNSTADYLKLGSTSVTGVNTGNSNPAAGFIIGSALTNVASALNGDIYALGVYVGSPSVAELAALSSAAVAMVPGCLT